MPDQQNVTAVSPQAKEAVSIEQAPAFDPVDCFKQMILARTINDVLKTRKTQGKFDFYIGCAGHEAGADTVKARLQANLRNTRPTAPRHGDSNFMHEQTFLAEAWTLILAQLQRAMVMPKTARTLASGTTYQPALG